MKKADIKPGVVYAVWNRNSEYDVPTPIVFLNAPADGVLYTKPRYPGTEAHTCFRRAPANVTKPKRGSWGSADYGYPTVQPDTGHERVAAEDLSRFTLADFEAATSAYGDGHRFALITSLGGIAGPWDEMKAEHDAREQAKREQRERDESARDRARGRATVAITALARVGIKADRASSSGIIDGISITLDEAEKLVALLGQEG